MKKGGGKSKGSEFERSICKKLSSWATNGERDDIFWRTSLSGGRATVNLKKGKINQQHVGDICAIDAIGYEFTDIFYTELKFYKNLHVDSFIFGTPIKGTILEIWHDTVAEGQQYSKQPVLICKQNFKELQVLCISSYTYSKLRVNNKNLECIAQFPKLDMYIVDLSHFLEVVDYQIFKLWKM